MFHEAKGRVLTRGTRGNLSCDVFVTDDQRLVKRYRLAHGAWRLRKPWRREHKALARLSGFGFPESLGYTERPLPAGREVVFICRRVAGQPLNGAADVRDGDLPRLAGLWATIHRHGVVTGDARAGGHLRRPDGSLVFVDFDRARTLRRGTPRFYYRVGRDLADLHQDTLSGDAARFADFLAEYRRQSGHPPAWRPVIRFGMAVEAALRVLKGALRRRGREP